MTHTAVYACCSDESSCLWTAAFRGLTDVVHALVSAGADVKPNLQRNDGATALSMASQEGHIDCEVLMRKTAHTEWCRS